MFRTRISAYCAYRENGRPLVRTRIRARVAADWLLEGREHAEMERAGVLDGRTSGVGGIENGCRKVAETMSCASRLPMRASKGGACALPRPYGSHAQQMMVIRSPLSNVLPLWSSHCQVNDRPHGADAADPYYQTLLFSVARGAAWRGQGTPQSLADAGRGSSELRGSDNMW